MATTNENLGENKTTTFHIAANDTGRSEEENPASVTENLAPPSPVNTGAGENGTETKEMEINGRPYIFTFIIGEGMCKLEI